MKVKGPSEEKKAINSFTSILRIRSYYCSMCRCSFKAQGFYRRHLINHKNNPHKKRPKLSKAALFGEKKWRLVAHGSLVSTIKKSSSSSDNYSTARSTTTVNSSSLETAPTPLESSRTSSLENPPPYNSGNPAPFYYLGNPPPFYSGNPSPFYSENPHPPTFYLENPPSFSLDPLLLRVRNLELENALLKNKIETVAHDSTTVQDLRAKIEGLLRTVEKLEKRQEEEPLIPIKEEEIKAEL